jgi:hypothetical protein
MKTYVHLWSYFAQFFSEWEMFQTKFVEKLKTHILCLIVFFRKSCHLRDDVEEYVKDIQAHRWQCNMAHVLCMLVILDYRHTLRIWNTYCFFHSNYGYTNMAQYYVTRAFLSCSDNYMKHKKALLEYIRRLLIPCHVVDIFTNALWIIKASWLWTCRPHETIEKQMMNDMNDSCGVRTQYDSIVNHDSA